MSKCWWVPGAAACAVSWLGGCAAGGHAPATAAPTAVADGDPDRTYLVGPTAARELGYRVAYEVPTHPDQSSGVRRVTVEGDSVFVLDGHNFVTRLRRSDGQRLWRIPVASPGDEVQGITYLAPVQRVFLTVGSDLYVLDETTGSVVDKQHMTSLASTAPVVFGGYFIYGARNGQLVWHSWEVGHTWRSYRVSAAMRLAPLLVGDLVAAVGSDGRVIVIDAPSVKGVWDKQLLNGVEAEPVTGSGLLYIAGLDQYLWAIDIGTGRTEWKYLADAPLRSGPVLVDDRVYQNIEGQGLVCFAAAPVDMPGGKVLWTAPRATGTVLTRLDDRLVAWDEQHRTAAVLDARRGSIITEVSLPSVQRLQATDLNDGDLFGTAEDGRVIRLVPRRGAGP